MQKFIYTATLFLIVLSSFSQGEKSLYDPKALFNPLFYSTSINEYRAANGNPGPKYWQNKANYQINASLDDVKEVITASVTVTYTNNSPHALSYIWLQLDQNLFDPSSRGQAKTPVLGKSRYGDANTKFKGGYYISSVKLISGTAGKTLETNLQTITTDTRMQLQLDKPIAANGGVIKFKIDYNYSIPMYGSDRTGILPT